MVVLWWGRRLDVRFMEALALVFLMGSETQQQRERNIQK